jgi:hypothetical protein
MANDPLKSYRAAVAAAESALERARCDMEAAAARFGISHHGMFSDSTFIWRSTGERWSRKAGYEGVQKGVADVLQGFQVLRDAGLVTITYHKSANSPFAHLGRVDIHEAETAADQMLANLISEAGQKRRSKI